MNRAAAAERNSMKRIATYLVVAALGAWAAIAFARANGAPASRTGAPATGSVPAESNCTGCHGGNALNSGGAVTILGVPTLFNSAHTYRLTVHLASTQTAGSTGRKWGFQLTAVDTVTGAGAGTFTLVNAGQTSLVTGTGSFSTRTYVNQNSGGVQSGTASPVEWQVDWTPPASGVTGVRFYAAGLAADGGGTTSGDWVYTGTAGTTDTTTAALPTTWGEVKRNYRR
jgi:mono/diheme cytochrome c family protein